MKSIALLGKSGIDIEILKESTQFILNLTDKNTALGAALMAKNNLVDLAVKELWGFHCVYDEPAPADVIVGLGSYDLRVADRCAELFGRGLAQTVMFTGATGNWTKELYDSSEAASFAQRAVLCGVPESAIIIEDQAKNMGENIKFSAQKMPSVRTAILVTKPQTQRRCAATACKQWPDTACMTTAPMTLLEDQPTGLVSYRDLICEMVGDMKRLELYPSLGFQSEIAIPTSVKDATNVLVDAGFVDHLP